MHYMYPNYLFTLYIPILKAHEFCLLYCKQMEFELCILYAEENKFKSNQLLVQISPNHF